MGKPAEASARSHGIIETETVSHTETSLSGSTSTCKWCNCLYIDTVQQTISKLNVSRSETLLTLTGIQVVQDCIGYRLGPWSHLCYVLLVLLSGGTFWVFVKLCPVLAIRLLASCPLQQADRVLVKVTDCKQCIHAHSL